MINILFETYSSCCMAWSICCILGRVADFSSCKPGWSGPMGRGLFPGCLEMQGPELACSILVLTTIGFVAAGVGIFARQAWWRPAVVAIAIFSSAIYFLFWDGGWGHLDNKGGICILINLAILVALLIFQWPNIELVNK